MIASIERTGLAKSKPEAWFAFGPEERNQSGSVASRTLDSVGKDISTNLQRRKILNEGVDKVAVCVQAIPMELDGWMLKME